MGRIGELSLNDHKAYLSDKQKRIEDYDRYNKEKNHIEFEDQLKQIKNDKHHVRMRKEEVFGFPKLTNP